MEICGHEMGVQTANTTAMEPTMSGQSLHFFHGTSISPLMFLACWVQTFHDRTFISSVYSGAVCQLYKHCVCVALLPMKRGFAQFLRV